MNRTAQLAVLALALSAFAGRAHGATLPRNDMDGDGRSDVVWRNDSTGELLYWSAANLARATRIRLVSSYSLPDGFNLGQTTGAFVLRTREEARSELMVVTREGYYAGVIYRYETPYAYHAYYDSTVPAPEWKLVGVGDFGKLYDGYNFDFGVDDFVYRNQVDGRNMLSYMSWDHRMYIQITAVRDLQWKIVGVGDFNGDGQADLLWRHATRGLNGIWMSANASRQIAMTQVRNLAWKVAAVADFNGDGRADIFWRNSATGSNVIWDSGNAATQRAAAGVVDQGWQVAAIGDYDGDGKSDLFWRNARTGADVVWKSANAGTRLVLPPVTNMAWHPLM